MAGNTFDFELNADDQASQEIANIEAELNKLRPVLKDVRESLKMGGDESISGLRDVGERIRDMSDFSKKGAQSIGDMIPPLKNFGELSGKYMDMAKKIGGIGAIGYAGYQMVSQVPEQAKKATEVSTSAKNTGMSVEEGTRLTGTLIQKGSTEEDARNIIENQFEQFSRAQNGDDNDLRAAIRSIGAEISTNKDGSVNMVETLKSLEATIKVLPEHRNWELRDKLKLPPELIALLREGDLQGRLDKSDRMGHTRKDAVVEQLSEMDAALKNISAAYEGAKTKTGDAVSGALLSDGSVIDGLNGVEQILTYGPDNVALMQTMGFLHDNDSDILRTTYNTPELYGNLGMWDQSMVDFGIMTDDIRKNYEGWTKERESARKAQEKEEEKQRQANAPDGWKQDSGYDPNVRAFRNNNPGNVRWTNNEIGRDREGVDAQGNKKGFGILKDENDGRAALARQLLLYMDRGNNTINGILNDYAPGADNNDTNGYIQHLTKHMGVTPNTPLDMYNPEILAQMMNGIIKKESGYQPYSYDEMMGSIDDAVNSSRWAGKRNPQRLLEQREQWTMRHNQDESKATPIINTEKDPAEVLMGFAEQLARVLDENKAGGTLEIVLTNSDTGTKSSVNVKPKGRVTTAMNMP
ncbi:hypothetical protein AAZR23_19135 [Morganella sp. Je.2.23]|uniref:hypothetical protein n=1 Tax=Morganella sp. Je.2.23 TaxID=3142840 RepID=UPI003DAA2BCD